MGVSSKLTNTCLVSRYSSSPHGPSSRPKPGLFVAAPWRFHIRWLHVINPDNSSAKRFHHAKRFINIPRPDRTREAIRRIVRDPDGVRLAFERNHRSHWTKNFFTRDPRVVVHVVKNCRLNIIAFTELLGPSRRMAVLASFLPTSRYELTRSYCSLLTSGPIFVSRSSGGPSLMRSPFPSSLRQIRVNLFFDQDPAAC